MPITFKNVSYVYNGKTPFESDALNGVSVSIKEGSFTAVVGRTGAGKSTLAQLINGLLLPTEGEVQSLNWVLSSSKKKTTRDLRGLRKEIGMVFQFPEYQLFEETVIKDVMFAPRNFGDDVITAKEKAESALKSVGVPEECFERSPFEVSGGERRKVALAGILAYQPKVLIIDEPTAGLDPASAKESMAFFKAYQEKGNTVILVTHDMDVVLQYAERVIVIEDGKVACDASPEVLFSEDCSKYSLDEPMCISFAKKLGLPINGIKNAGDLAKLIAEGRK